MRRLLALGALALAAVMWAVATPAMASVGVGTDMRSIDVTQPLAAGGSYALHPFTIINTGTQDSGFGIQISATSKPGPRVPASWLSFKPSAFYLSPKQGAEVAPTLNIPLDAEPGIYQVLLLGVPKLPSDLAPGGHVNVGVGPRLTFTVVQPDIRQRMYFLFQGWMPWSAIAALALLVALVGGTWVAVWRRLTKKERLSSRVSDAPLPEGGEED